MTNPISKASKNDRRSSTIPRGLFITGTDTNVGKTHVTCLIARQLIAEGIRVAAYKPVCSGASNHTDEQWTPNSKTKDDSDAKSVAGHCKTSESALIPNSIARWDDVDRLCSATQDRWTKDLICPQRFIAPLAPPVAAKLEGRQVDSRLLAEGAYRFSDADVLLIEGVGGWLSPISEELSVADLACQLNAPVLIIARAGLGTINHTLLTIESVRRRGLDVAGVVLNEVVPLMGDESWRTNGDEIESRGEVSVFGTVPHANSLELHRDGQPVTIDWQTLTRQIANREIG